MSSAAQITADQSVQNTGSLSIPHVSSKTESHRRDYRLDITPDIYCKFQ